MNEFYWDQCHKKFLAGGQVWHWQNFLGADQSQPLYRTLLDSTLWQQEEITLFGRQVKQPRLTAWYGLGMSADSRYTRSAPAQPWFPLLEQVKTTIEAVCQSRFNSVLCNLYRTGQDSVSLHDDREACLGPSPLIASLSLGATRRFVLKSKKLPKHTLNYLLEDGSLLVMAGNLQRHWLHGVPKTSRQVKPRLNLTFRWIHTSEPGRAPAP